MSTGATVHWIDKDGRLQYHVIMPYHLKGGATYNSEALHISDGAEHCIVIPNQWARQPAEIERLEQLKKKAIELQNNLAQD